MSLADRAAAPGQARPPNWADRVAGGLERVLDVVLGTMLLVIAVSIIWQVIGRYVFDKAPSWSEEVARQVMVWIALLGAGATLRSGNHITVLALLDRLPPRAERVVLAIRDALVALIAVVICVYGYDFAQLNDFQDSAALEIPMSIVYSGLWIGGGLLIVMLALCRLGNWGDWTRPRNDPHAGEIL